MYIMLLKVYYSAFSAFTACTSNWLNNDRSLVETKLNRSINSVCLWLRTITKKAEILVQNTEITVWKYTVKTTVHGTWNIANTVSDCWCQNRLAYVMLVHIYMFSSSRPEVFYKKICSEKFCKIHRKTPVPESPF